MPVIRRIEGATRELGKPADWNENRDAAHCSTLPVRDVITPEGPFMISAWELTPDELAALQRGETLKLWIRGTSHPVVAISVGAVPA
jgi:hypothetical protein